MDSGVASRPIEDMGAYRDKLAQFVYRTSLMMKPVYDRARSDKQRVVYAEGEEEVVLQAVQNVVDDGLAHPILIGRLEVIESRIERLGLRLKIGENVEVTNINDDPRFNEYWQYYHGLTGRRGVTVAAAKNLMRSRPTLIAAVMVARGEADAMLTGIVGRFHKKLGYVRSVLPLEPKVTSTSAMTGVNQQGVFFFVDTHVQEDPTAEQLCEATLQAAYRMKLFGIEPKVALLSHSNFGSHDSKDALKMRQVRELLLKRNPRLNVDGEMQGDTAWDEALRQKLLPGSTLQGRANLFVLPNLEAANIAYNLVRVFTDGVAIGPILMGVNKPVHILTTSATSRRILNMTAIAAVDAQIRKQLEAEKKACLLSGSIAETRPTGRVSVCAKRTGSAGRWPATAMMSRHATAAGQRPALPRSVPHALRRPVISCNAVAAQYAHAARPWEGTGPAFPPWARPTFHGRGCHAQSSDAAVLPATVRAVRRFRAVALRPRCGNAGQCRRT